MPLPIAALARAASGAAKAGRAAHSAKRAMTAGDKAYNARRRFRRQAQRFLDKADNSTGMERQRYLAQARGATQNALDTYTTRPQGQVKSLAERLGMDLQNSFQPQTSKKRMDTLLNQSFDALQGNQRNLSRDDMARNILDTGNIGSRLYGGLIDVWGDTPEHRAHPNQTIMDYFDADSLMDVLEKIEDAGIDIYRPDENDQTYKSIQLQLQNFVLENAKGTRHGTKK